MNKKLKASLFISFIFLTIVLIQSCTKESLNGSENENENSQSTSNNGTSKSHNMGQNCMNCHKQGGPGEGWFTVAGTAYDNVTNNTYPNVTVKLYTGPNGTGTLMYTLSGDNLGNFYTTQNINFSGGLYPAVQGKTTTMFMSTSIGTGQCNSCHGVSTGKIWAQ